MATLKLALLAREVTTDQDGKLASILGIVDTCGGFVTAGRESVTLLFWCAGAAREVVRFHVEIASPQSMVRGQDLQFAIDRNDREEVAAVPLVIGAQEGGKHTITLWFDEMPVWSTVFTVGAFSAPPAGVQ